MQTQTLKTLDQLLFVHLEISCWSGKKTLTPDDLGLDRSQLPPETLISLGDKQLINPDALRAFTAVRGAARRQCLAVGARFMGGYAIPTGKAAALLDRLTALEATYTQAKADFLATYDQQLDGWARQQPPEWQKLIREALVPASYVSGRLDFRVQVARFSLPETVGFKGTLKTLYTYTCRLASQAPSSPAGAIAITTPSSEDVPLSPVSRRFKDSLDPEWVGAMKMRPKRKKGSIVEMINKPL